MEDKLSRLRKTAVLVELCMFFFADDAFCSMGGLISKVKIPVQELGGQRGEGAYFREDTVYF